MSISTVSLVGRPNVGKSTLFNKLCKSRDALVSDFEGLTRDRQYADIKLTDTKVCRLVDTGGLTTEDSGINKYIEDQVKIAIEESEIVIFLLSAKEGLTTLDTEIASIVRRYKKNTLLVVNKSEGLSSEKITEFYELGLGEPIPIAAEHGLGLDTLKEVIADLISESNDEVEEQIEGIAVGIVGRPNVGKSTLVNRILGEDRVLALDMPGTTRDSIYIPFEKNNQQYTLIDTAGIRRKRSVKEKIEKFSIVKSIDAIKKSHVVILIMDAHEGVTEQDASLLGMIEDHGRALLIVINKWDGLTEYQKEEVKRKLDLKLSFVNYSSIHYISALHGSGVGKLFLPINKAYKSAGLEFSTSQLNRVLERANQSHQSPSVSGRKPKIKFIHQSGTFPPSFTLHGNHLNNLPNSYLRFLKNFLSKDLGIENTPVKLEFKNSENPFKDKVNKLSERQVKKKRRMMKFVKKK